MLPLRVTRCPAHLVVGMDVCTVLQEVNDAQEGPPLDRQVKGRPARLLSGIGVSPTFQEGGHHHLCPVAGSQVQGGGPVHASRSPYTGLALSQQVDDLQVALVGC